MTITPEELAKAKTNSLAVLAFVDAVDNDDMKAIASLISGDNPVTVGMAVGVLSEVIGLLANEADIDYDTAKAEVRDFILTAGDDEEEL